MIKDTDEAVQARIAANDNWDNNVTKMVARLNAEGLSDDEIIDKAVEENTPEQTRQEISAKVKRMLKKHENS